jgi:hypothetical protein
MPPPRNENPFLLTPHFFGKVAGVVAAVVVGRFFLLFLS